MENKEPQIKISDPHLETVKVIQEQKSNLEVKISDPYLEGVKIVQEQMKDIKNSFKWSITFIIGVLALGFVTLLFMVAAMLIDAWHFNSTIYKENKVLELNSKVIKNSFDQQQDIIERLDKIEKKTKGAQ